VENDERIIAEMSKNVERKVHRKIERRGIKTTRLKNSNEEKMETVEAFVYNVFVANGDEENKKRIIDKKESLFVVVIENLFGFI
jgi:hypothetical protein